MNNKNRTHGYEKFLYRTRGRVTNVTATKGKVEFNMDPIPPYASNTVGDDVDIPSITLVGKRLVQTPMGMQSEHDVIAIPQSTTFDCSNYPPNMKDGEYHEIDISEKEINRIKSSMFETDLVVNVVGIL